MRVRRGFRLRRDILSERKARRGSRVLAAPISIFVTSPQRAHSRVLWQAKMAKEDYHAAMPDVMFMDWLSHRLSPAFEQLFGHKKMILVLDNAPYHHGFDPEVKVPEITARSTTPIFCESTRSRRLLPSVAWTTATAARRTVSSTVRYQQKGPSFRRRDLKMGVSRAKVAQATPAYFNERDPSKHIERLDRFMQDEAWELTRTPPYMPSLHPIELLWQYGKH